MERAERIVSEAEEMQAKTMRFGNAKPLKGRRLVDAKERQAQLAEELPMLFEMIAEGRFAGQADLERLRQMVGLFASVNRGEVTYENASKTVGKQQADEFLNPVIRRLDRGGGEGRVTSRSEAAGGGGGGGGGSAPPDAPYTPEE